MKFKERWMYKRIEGRRQEKLQLIWNAFNKVVNSDIAKKITQTTNLEQDLQSIKNIFIQDCRSHQIEKYIIFKSKPYIVLKQLINCQHYERVGLVVSQLQRCGSKHKE